MIKFAKLCKRYVVTGKCFVVVNVIILILALSYMLDVACVNVMTVSFIQGGPIKCYHFSIIPKFSNVNLFKIFIQRFVITNIKPTFNINEFVKSELCRERNKDLCLVCV